MSLLNYIEFWDPDSDVNVCTMTNADDRCVKKCVELAMSYLPDVFTDTQFFNELQVHIKNFGYDIWDIDFDQYQLPTRSK